MIEKCQRCIFLYPSCSHNQIGKCLLLLYIDYHTPAAFSTENALYHHAKNGYTTPLKQDNKKGTESVVLQASGFYETIHAAARDKNKTHPQSVSARNCRGSKPLGLRYKKDTRIDAGY